MMSDGEELKYMNDFEEYDRENLMVDYSEPVERSSSSPEDELQIDEHQPV